MRSHLPATVCFVAATILGAAACLAAEKRPVVVRSPELQLEFRAPADWIVRHSTEEGEKLVTISRELRKTTPRYDVGLSAKSLNNARRKMGFGAVAMARELCAMARTRGVAITECRESHAEGFLQVEWRVLYPPTPDSADGTVAWIKCLADDESDVLVRLTFESLQADWESTEKAAQELMNGVRRLRQLD
ncbi:MAG: hypothetical protein ACREUC_17320 [Steroidobacteraceae bacterium]